MPNNLIFRDGRQFEEWLFGRSYKREGGKPFLVINKFSEFARKIILAITEEDEKFPNTIFSKSLYLGVRAYLEKMGICTEGFHLYASVGSDADVYYFTDALVYLPQSSGYECVSSLDAFLIKDILALRDFWIETFSSGIFTEDDFQSCLFRHKMIVSEHMRETKGADLSIWIFSKEYKRIWTSGREVSWSVNDPDRPNQRPENHFLVTQWHLLPHRRKSLAKLIAKSLAKQINNCVTLPAAS